MGDLVLVWGATELHHKVSEHYTSGPRRCTTRWCLWPAEAITHLKR
jgi:hypothetical protein